MPKQNKLAVLGAAEFVERGMIGCGYDNKVTKEEDCNYWVHQ